MENTKKLVYFLFIISIGILSISCSTDDEKTNVLLEPELFKDFTISDGNITRGNPGVSVTWTIGRKSKNCKKIGLCKIVHITIHLRQNDNLQVKNNEITTTLKKINNEYFIFIKMDNYLDPNKYDTNFYIDEDIINDNISIDKGVFTFDNSIGDFGGYKIPVNYIK